MLVFLSLPLKARPSRRASTFWETRPLSAVITNCCPNADLSQHKSLQTDSSVFLRLVITSRTAALDVRRTSNRAAWQLCEAYGTPHLVIAGSEKSQARQAFAPSRSVVSLVFSINYLLLFLFPVNPPKVASRERQISRREGENEAVFAGRGIAFWRSLPWARSRALLSSGPGAPNGGTKRP